MNFNRITDLLLNVLLPLLLGYIVYQSGQQGGVALSIKNYLPDGLWAYAFVSALLIIWNRKLPIAWIISVYLLAAGFELLQYYKIAAGRADGWDVAVYFIFISLGLLLNNVFKRLYFHKTPVT